MPVFLDANSIIYALDQTSDQYSEVVHIIQKLLDKGTALCTSHHVIEEVVHIARRVADIPATAVINEVGKIPGLILIEPDATLSFAERYAKLSDTLKMGVNDSLLLQLMLDAGITHLLSYDKQFVQQASSLGIKQIFMVLTALK